MELTTRDEGSIDISSDSVIKDPFFRVKAQYVQAIANQNKRMARQRRDFYTKHEHAAITFYDTAFRQIEAL